MENVKKILMASVAITIFVVAAIILYINKKEKEEFRDIPAPQEQQVIESESVEKEALDSLSAPIQPEEDVLSADSDKKEVLESASAPQNANIEEGIDEEVLKSLEAPVK